MSTPWQTWPDLASTLSRELLHVVRVSLAGEGVGAVDDWQELTESERARARRYVVEPPRRRFLQCRRALRRCLAELTGCLPAAIDFGTERNGKPRLQSPVSPQFQFNVSHSGDWGVVAFGWGSPLGVDIETLDPQLDILGLADRFFSADEQAELRSLPPEQQRLGFYRLWTSKEAYMKGLGLGMLLPLGSFTMAADPLQPPQLLGGDVREGPWFGEAFCVAEDVPGVLLWSGGPRDVCFWNAPSRWECSENLVQESGG